MKEEIENLLSDIESDFEKPDVAHIHDVAAARKQSRETAARVAAVAIVAFVIAGVGFWITRPSPTELATGTDDTASTVAGDSAPVVAPESQAALLQRRLVNTNRWFVESREGIPASANPDGDLVSFTDDQIGFSNCEGISYDITWTLDGFKVERPTPVDPSIPVPLIGCDGPVDGILRTPMPSGLQVSVEATSSQTIRLTSDEWQLSLSANPTGDEMLAYLSLTIEEAGDLAESNGLPWRVVHRDGEDLGFTLAFNADRLNFTTQDGIVIHVRSDEELGQQSSSPTTTIVEPANEYLTLTIEEAGALADANGREWRVVSDNNRDVVVADDLVPGRLNFGVIDGRVSSLEIETDPTRSPSLTLQCAGQTSSTVADFLRPLTEGAASAEEAIADFQENGSDWQRRPDWQGLTLATIRGNAARASAVFLDANDKTYLVVSVRQMDGFWVVDGVQSCEP